MLLLVTDHAAARVGVAIYGTSLALLFGVSAAYHRLARSPRAQRVMRRLDHSMIFVLIAGTYTPICLVALPSPWGVSILSTVWGLAGLGIGAKILGPDRVLKIASSLYLLLGWVALVALPVLLRSLTRLEMGLLVAGGVLYTVGAILFHRRRPDPNPAVFGYHEIWHSFTVMAGASHFAMVALVVR